MCAIFGLGTAATIGLLLLAGSVGGVTAVKLFKVGLAKFKAKFFPPKPPAA